MHNAVTFHTKNAVTFTRKYDSLPGFQKRFRVWTGLFAWYIRPADAVPDLGFGSGVLEYLDDLPGMLQQVYELLKPGGLLLVSMPNRQSAYRTLARFVFQLTGKPAYYAYVRHVVTADVFARQLSAFGFERLNTVLYAGSAPVSQRLAGLLPERHANNLFVSVYKKCCKK